jgi:hypothetical protein
MKDEKARFLEKLGRIEDHSRVLAADLPPSFAKTRAVHILRTARDLKAKVASDSFAMFDLSAESPSAARQPASPGARS